VVVHAVSWLLRIRIRVSQHLEHIKITRLERSTCSETGLGVAPWPPNRDFSGTSLSTEWFSPLCKKIRIPRSVSVSVTNLFSARKLRHKNAIGGATWEWGANCPCDGRSSMSSSETWNTEVCCTVVAHAVIHSRFVVQPQISDEDQMKCQCEEPLAGPSWKNAEYPCKGQQSYIG